MIYTYIFYNTSINNAHHVFNLSTIRGIAMIIIININQKFIMRNDMHKDKEIEI